MIMINNSGFCTVKTNLNYPLKKIQDSSSCPKKLSLCFKWAPRHEGILEEWRYSSTHSLTSALDGGE
jgi:hypothetical protein